MASETECLWHKNFDPIMLHTAFYIKPKPVVKDFMMYFYEIYNSDKFLGTSLLDLGSGPTIHWLAAASRKYTDITVSTLLDTEQTELKKWLQKSPNALDWAIPFKWAAAAEDISSHMVIEERIRSSVKNIILCDVRQENPLLNVTNQFDVVQCTFVVDNVASDQDSFKCIIKNICNVVKSGGAFVMINALKATYFKMGSHKFPKFYINETILEDALVDAGFQDIGIRNHSRDSDPWESDYEGYIMSTAFKK